MAINYIVGIPGSGKTYFAVYKIWQSFIYYPKNSKKKDDIKKYEFCYTNINQFKYDTCDKIKSLDFDELKFNLEILYNLYKSVDGKDDKLLIEKAKELNLNDCMFAIDECHNFLNDKENEVLKWWLTYHRHIGHEIYLITQDLSLVATGYKSIAEFFFRAVPASRRLFSKKFKYFQYTSYKMYDKDLISNTGIHIPFKDEVFNLYYSGSASNQKSYVKIYLYLFLFFILLSAFTLYIFVEFVLSDDSKQEIKNDVNITTHYPSITNKKNNFNQNINSSENIYFYIIRCYKDDCFLDNDTNKFTLKQFYYIIQNNEFVYQETTREYKNQFKFILGSKKPIFDNYIFHKGIKNETDFSNSNSNFSSSFKPSLF